MESQAPGELWPPQLGDYARVRQSGILGEVIDITRRGEDAEYTVNLFAPSADGISELDLEDLAPVWPATWMRWTCQAG